MAAGRFQRPGGLLGGFTVQERRRRAVQSHRISDIGSAALGGCFRPKYVVCGSGSERQIMPEAADGPRGNGMSAG